MLGHSGNRSESWVSAEVDRATRDDVLALGEGLPGSVEDYHFGDDVAVFKVAGRMSRSSCSTRNRAG